MKENLKTWDLGQEEKEQLSSAERRGERREHRTIAYRSVLR